MDLMSNVIINTFSAMILIIISVYSAYQKGAWSFQNKLYISMLHLTIILLVLDTLGRLDGYPDTIIPFLNHISNFLMFLINPILPSIWLLFVYNHIYQPERQNRLLIIMLIVINGIHALILSLSQYYGWIYYIDSNNIYHRGAFFLLSASFSIFLLIGTSVLIAVNHGKIEKKHFFSLLFFPIPPFICVILQIFIYGMSLILNGVVLSLLIILLYIQNQGMNIDYLTGVYNRKKLEAYLKSKVNTSTENKTFSAIMIDLNDFKYINDTFGHNNGDEALQISAKLLKSCIKSNDFIARYGGDEFCIILDTSEVTVLETVVSMINKCIDKYNESNNRPFKLGLSMGYAVYEFNSRLSAEEFQNKIDKLMYTNKLIEKEKRRDILV